MIWATAREVLSPQIIQRIESETAAIETTLGAGGTHDITRLLRLPGTINFPNAAKRAKGRGIGRARMIYHANNLYSAEQIAGLAARLNATVPADLVRLKTKPDGPTSPGRDADVAALAGELAKAGADAITAKEHLSDDLQQRLDAALKAKPRLSDRWAGMIDDLTEAGRDSSRSSLDLSLAALLKRAGFDHLDAGLILCAFAHGKANGDPWTGNARLRHVARCVLRSHEPKPRADGDEIEWGAPVDFIADQDTPPPELRQEHIPDALWPFVVDTSERLGVDKACVALGGLTSVSSVISDDWFIQPKMYDSTWLINARLWGLIIGDPSILKSPVIALCTRPVEWLDRQAREVHQMAMQTYRQDMAAWKKADDQSVPQPAYPRLARYLVEGATVEALSEVLRDDPEGKQHAPAGKVLCRQDEMSELFANMDRYRAGGKGDGDRGAYLRLFNGGRYTVDRIGRGSFAIPNWSAGIFGGCQPGPIQRIAKDAADDGMLQRFLFVVPGPQARGVDRIANHAAIDRYNALVPAITALQPGRDAHDRPRRVVIHKDAHRLREYIDNLAVAMSAMPDVSPRLKSTYGKWPGMFAALVLTFHLINIADCRARNVLPPPVDVVPEETVTRVARFMRDIILPHLLRADALMYRTNQTGHARWIAGYILAKGLKEVTSRDITRNYGALRAPECRKELADVMTSLELVGWLEPVDPGNPLKLVSTWLVNPAVHTMFAEKAAAERDARQQSKEAIAATIEELKKRSGI